MRLAPIGVKRTAMCAQDTSGLRALGSKWARLLDNLPDVSHFCRCAGCLSGTNLWDKKSTLEQELTRWGRPG